MFIALFSLAISIIAIYHSIFKKPHLTAHVGPQVVAIYEERDLTITVPVTIANDSPNIGAVERCALTIAPLSKRNQNWHMVWESFRTITADGSTWVQKGVAHSIPVLSRSKSTENIRFKWQGNNTDKLELEEGGYMFRLDFMTSKNAPNLSVKYQLYISKDDASLLVSSRTHDKTRISSGVVYLSLDSETRSNKLLTDSELDSWIN